MCGIIGYIGKNNSLPIVLNGLKSLEYRGYDSSGIAYKLNEDIKIVKETGKIINLEKIMDDDYSNIGIGHTRWATHGKPCKENSHPHQMGDVTIVHNGIIENYQELKEFLIENNYQFKSETDSEVVAGLIDYYYQTNKNILEVLQIVQNKLIGSYALGIMFLDDENLYAMKNQSPLIVGKGDNEYFIASDVPAILDYTKNYYLVDDLEIVKLTNNSVEFYKDGQLINKELLSFDFKLDVAKKNGYEHFMLKEINEEGEVISNLYHLLKQNDFNDLPDLSKYNEIDIIACGSAYYSGMVSKYLIEKYLNIRVNVCIASEYRYQKHILTSNKLVILISQSGETADTIACLKIAKEFNYDTLGVVNVVGSTIARMVDKVLYINAGCEIAVATTKAYLLQVFMLSLIVYKNMKIKERIEFDELKDLINSIINQDYSKYVDKLYNHENIFFIGRLIDYALCLEGSLKLKEISYIHSEAYQAGELKHGTISLITEGMPVIAIVTDLDIASKTISNIKEVKARGAYVLLVIREGIEVSDDLYDDIIVIKNVNDLIMPILTVIPLQLIAYNVAVKRGCDIDKPRNLAKSVTVE